MKAILQRLTSDSNGTFGVLLIGGRPYYTTLELPWRDNQKNISCIPAGTYHATKMYSDRFLKYVYVLHDVPGRDMIELHIGNRITDTTGCILLGLEYGLNEYAIVNSRIAFEDFMSQMPSDGFILTVNDVIVKGDTAWV